MSTTVTLTRRQDWPERLAAVLEAARHQPYALGTHDCLRVTCQCIEAMTGVDLWPRFVGYTTRRQALKTIAAIAPSLGEAVSLVLGRQPQPLALSQRGDVLLYADARGEHLGICTGASMALLADEGLTFVPASLALASWRVG